MSMDRHHEATSCASWYSIQFHNNFVVNLKKVCIPVNHIQKTHFSFIMAFEDSEDAALHEGHHTPVIMVRGISCYQRMVQKHEHSCSKGQCANLWSGPTVTACSRLVLDAVGEGHDSCAAINMHCENTAIPRREGGEELVEGL